MTPSNGTRITAALACTAALAAALPAAASAKPRKHRAHHSVIHKAAAVPQPTITVPHKYDAGGDGGALTLPAGAKANLFDPVAVLVGLGNNELAQLGLPPVPTLPALPTV